MAAAPAADALPGAEEEGDERGRRALLLGATGLVGGHVLDLLLDHPRWARVTVWTRRPPERAHPRLEVRSVDFDRLDETAGEPEVDDLLCCLGTTMKRAGSREAFRRVDRDYPLAAARLALAGGATRCAVVSALGADAESRVFYNRVKGEVEAGLRGMPWEALAILRPSLLLGHRDGDERPGEALAQRAAPVLSPLLVGPLRRYRPVDARTVARAMVKLAATMPPGVTVAESDELQRLGG